MDPSTAARIQAAATAVGEPGDGGRIRELVAAALWMDSVAQAGGGLRHGSRVLAVGIRRREALERCDMAPPPWMGSTGPDGLGGLISGFNFF